MLLVTQNTTFDNINFDIGRTENSAADAHKKVSTGRRVNHASDDPIASVRGTLASANLASLHAMDRVAHVAESQLQTSEAILSECVGQMGKIVELAVGASAGHLNAANRVAIGEEVATIHSFIVNAANQQQAGSYLFSGLSNQTPFDADGTYNGNSGIRQVPVAFGLNAPVNLPGNQVFNVVGGQNILGALQDFVTALNANDQQGCEDAIETSQKGLDQLTAARSSLSASLIKVQEAEQKRADTMLLLRKERSDVIEVDQAGALVEMSRMSTSLDTALSAAARVIGQLRSNPLMR